jgi:hypothetical protein
MGESFSPVPFRSQLRIAWLVCFRYRLSRRRVEPSEPISRFLFFTKEFSAEKLCVKPIAFLAQDPATEHSVFRVAKLLRVDIFELGRWKVCPTRQKNFYGYATLSVAVVARVGPQVKASEPPKRHAIMIGWPATKAERMSMAQQLAAEATYTPHSSE